MLCFQQALDHLNNKQNRMPYFDLYDDDFLQLMVFLPTFPQIKKVLRRFILVYGKPFLLSLSMHILIGGNKAAVRFTMIVYIRVNSWAYHQSNKSFKVQGMSLFVFNDSKRIERWELIDMVSMIEQLSSRQQISALMNGILEFAEVKANKDLKEKITGLFKQHQLENQ